MKMQICLIGMVMVASPSGFAAADVTGPSSSTANALVRFDGTTGKLIKNSGATLSDAGTLSTTTLDADALTLVAPPMLGAQNFFQSQSYTGTSSSMVGENMNLMLTTSDNAAMALGVHFLNNFRIDHTWGGSSAIGGRQALMVNLEQSAASSSSNDNRNYVGTFSQSGSSSGDGGTGLTSSTAKGAYFAFGGLGLLESGATNVLNLTSAEFNVAAQSGSSVYYKSILSLVGHNTDAVQGTGYDAMLSLSNQGGVAWKDGILFSAANSSYPIASTGTIIRSSEGSVANGIDLSGTSFSSAAFKSPGFYVDGVGKVYGGESYFTHMFLAGVGNSAYLMSTGSADLFMGTHGSRTLYFVTANTIQGHMYSSGRVEFYGGIENTSIGANTPGSGAFSSLKVSSAAPSTSTSAGSPGQITWDSNYLYVCVGTNSWKRVALSSW